MQQHLDEHLAARADTLARTRQIQDHTIEKITAKSDLELGLEVLLGPGYLLRPGPD